MAPLITPGHQRMMTITNSQALAAGQTRNNFVTSEVTEADIQREREKISRFMNIKERNCRVLAEREKRINTRIMDMDKKQKEFEKRKKADRKMEADKANELRTVWLERR